MTARQHRRPPQPVEDPLAYFDRRPAGLPPAPALGPLDAMFAYFD